MQLWSPRGQGHSTGSAGCALICVHPTGSFFAVLFCESYLPALPQPSTLPPLPSSSLKPTSPPSLDRHHTTLPPLHLSNLDSTSPPSLDPRQYLPSPVSLPSTLNPTLPLLTLDPARPSPAEEMSEKVNLKGKVDLAGVRGRRGEGVSVMKSGR
eukprot:1720061-Rhodomonas_salina.1